MSLVLALIGLVAVPLLAIGTPRQAAELFAAPLGATRQRVLRGMGFLLLGTGFVLAMGDGDVTRTLIAWIGQLSLAALLTALACTIVRTRRGGRGR
ncbi:DUF3325 family protein [Gluconacetobacter azotocaptans]|uniref:DUF3325 family protein n=1 Tax=Gluconacetobacter azotocaptans TaxID=142834 RepID=A0A7W4JQ32_9PROT|nr:DUF3325 family protein [Gluconacetobacter azotocaptans]MBB2188829.1 DUF3325 family protein [Gluconacetobacter azotocaptans]GBQ31163.1 hypothetical protein AA13594_1986 [Gluconacetobacter azotocaptans DSM 13594]